MSAESEPLENQIDRLANFIMAEVPGEPSQSEGAVDCAIRWMRSRLAASPVPTRDDVLEEAAKKADRIADIIKRNLYHQHEKVEDARMFALQLAGDLRSLKGGKS